MGATSSGNGGGGGTMVGSSAKVTDWRRDGRGVNGVPFEADGPAPGVEWRKFNKPGVDSAEGATGGVGMESTSERAERRLRTALWRLLMRTRGVLMDAIEASRLERTPSCSSVATSPKVASTAACESLGRSLSLKAPEAGGFDV